MARLSLTSVVSRTFCGLFHGAPNRRARRALGRKAPSTRPAGSSRRGVRPCLEALEDRITPTTFTPTTFADDGTANSLRGAISQANADTGTTTDIIQLQAGTYTLSIANTAGHETGNAQGDLNIANKDHGLVIEGTENAGAPTTTIDQTVADRVFQIVSPDTTVIFLNLIIEGGVADDNGTSGVAAGTTEADGGGILDDGGNVTLSNVSLENNIARAGVDQNANGGGIYVGAGGVLAVTDSVLETDNALAGSAAANTSNNGGSASGGGIFSLGQTSIKNSTLENNNCNGGNGSSGDGGNAEGGDVDAVGPTTITDSTLENSTLRAGSSTNQGAGGFAEGGSVWLGSGSNSTLSITGSTLADNKLIAGNGGHGGNADGGSVLDKGSTTITDSFLSDDRLTGGGGDITRSVAGVTDVGGDAIGGGVFSLVGSPLTISGSNLSGNTLQGGLGTLNNSNTTIAGDVGGQVFGGGVFAGGQTNISSSSIQVNTITGGNGTYDSGTVEGTIGGSAFGGGVYFNPGNTSAPILIIASTLSGNSVTGGSGSGGSATPGGAEGGGAFFAGGAGDAIINSTIAGNQVNGATLGFGGGLFLSGGTNPASTVLINDTVADNSANGTDSSGGGIANLGATVDMFNTLVALNSASNSQDYLGDVSNNNDDLIGIANGSTGFSTSHGDQLGNTSSPLNPELSTLASNGGPTDTIALLANSPAINAGDSSFEVDTGPFDQRGQGFARVVNGAMDIGAFEVQPAKSPTASRPPSASSPSPAPPPTLNTPPLLAFFDSLLAAVETINSNGTETVTDSIFGFPLIVATYDSAGDLLSITLFGMNVTSLFESL
jgi:hypothetical protein